MFVDTRRLNIHNNRIFPLIGQNRCIAAVFTIKHTNITVHHRLNSVDSRSQLDGIVSLKIGLDLLEIRTVLPSRINPYHSMGYSGPIQGDHTRQFHQFCQGTRSKHQADVRIPDATIQVFGSDQKNMGLRTVVYRDNHTTGIHPEKSRGKFW